MTTAEAIEGMTDSGKFEILALRSLKILDKDCMAVIHLGVNAQGKTVRNPVDGFCQVPGSNPSVYILPTFTLCGERDLKRKWLLDRTGPTGDVGGAAESQARDQDDGDLAKAARYAAKLREANPRAKFIVHLCTNRVPPSELIKDVYLKADTLGLEIRFLEQSRLRDFLDSDPQGQWLRQEHLGIEADQLSLPLLQFLSRVTLEHYAAEMLFAEASTIVETDATRDLWEAIRQPTISMHALIGPSGVGKTVIAYEVLRQHLEAKGVGLWISHEIVERARTLSEAVEEVLRATHARLEKGCGETAIRFGTAKRPLLLVIDDVNRSSSASNIIQKVTGWARLAHGTGQNAKVEPSAVRLLCPIWDSNYRLNRQLFESTDGLRTQSLGPLLRSESVECLRLALGDLAGSFSDLELADFAEVLRDDPILLALFSQRLKKQTDAGPLAQAHDVIGNWIDQAVGDVAERSGLAPAQYRHALKQLSSEMVRKKKLYPKWSDLEEWFNSKQQIPTLLGHLAAKGAVCRLSGQGGSSEFQFRHDRILEYHLRESLSEMLAQDPPNDSVWDPFFVPYTAWVLAVSKVSSELLDLVIEKSPVALIAAVEHLPSEKSEGNEVILAKAQAWLGSASANLQSVRDDAYELLSNIESAHFLTLTEGLGVDRRLLFGRLRNGDAASGTLVLSRDFFPATHYHWLETLIDRAKSRHCDQLVSGLQEILKQRLLADHVRSGALCLAGYLGDNSLAAAVSEAWNNARDPKQFLLETLWAALRCSNDNPEEVLTPIFAAILDLKDDSEGGALSGRLSLLQNLEFTVRHGLSDPVINFLSKLGQSEEYERIVTTVLDRITHPVAVNFVVRSMAHIRHSAEERGGFYPWKPSWADPIQRARRETTALPPAAEEALRKLWLDEANSEWLRKYALECWASVGKELSDLQSIPQTSPLHDAAVRYRAEKGDTTVVPALVAIFKAKRHWLQLLAKAWCQQAADAVDHYLTLAESAEGAASEYDRDLAHILRDIPLHEAEPILLKHWQGLNRKPLFVQTALYLSTDKSRSVAAESVRLIASDPEVFRNISMFFGFFVFGLAERLSIRHLESLRPYIERLDAHCIDYMLRFCQQHGYWHWATEVLRPECSRRAKTSETIKSNRFQPDFLRLGKVYFPTDANLVEYLNDAEKDATLNSPGHLWYWLEGFSKRGDSPDRAFQLAENWLKAAPSLDRFRIVATLIYHGGTRRHLSILEKCAPVRDTREAATIIADVSYSVRRRSLL